MVYLTVVCCCIVWYIIAQPKPSPALPSPIPSSGLLWFALTCSSSLSLSLTLSFCISLPHSCQVSQLVLVLLFISLQSIMTQPSSSPTIGCTQYSTSVILCCVMIGYIKVMIPQVKSGLCRI